MAQNSTDVFSKTGDTNYDDQYTPETGQEDALFTGTTDADFLHLPPELRNRIYNLLFSGNAIQVSDPDARRGRSCGWGRVNCSDFDTRDEETKTRSRSFRRLDLNSSGHKLLLETAGAVHAKEHSVTEGHLAKTLSRSATTYVSARVDLSVQLLRTCRQIHNEAALLPYTENCFVFLDGLAPDLSKPLERYIGLKQRQAIRSAAVFDVGFSSQRLNQIPRLLPGLIELCIDVSLFMGWRQRNRHERVSPKDRSNSTLPPEAIAYIKERWEEETSQLKANFEALGGLQLTSAAVHLHSRSRWMQVDKDENRLVAENLEKVLLYGKADNEDDAEGLGNN